MAALRVATAVNEAYTNAALGSEGGFLPTSR
jgi:hypothetical protein